MLVKSLPTLHINNVLVYMYSISSPYLQMFSQGFFHPTVTALLTCHLHMLTQGVHLLSSLCSVSLCQVPLICTNTHLQPTIEALFRVGTLLIQQVPYQELGSGHGQLPCRDYRASESYYKYVNLSCAWCFIFIYGFIKWPHQWKQAYYPKSILALSCYQ